jgi:transposase, IS5 family
MIRQQTIRARDKLISKFPVTGEMLRGTLLERTVRHRTGCPKCERGEGHQVFVLTVSYPGGRTRQFSVRRERVKEVRRWLANYQKLKGPLKPFANSIMTCCARNGLRQNRGRSNMIEMRRKQLSFGDGLIAEEVSDLREKWMAHADEVLADEEIVTIVYEAMGKRHPKSRCRGRRSSPAEMVLRLLALKHIRNWSYEELEREVRANLVYRDFTRVGAGKVPDAKTMGRWGVALGPQVLKQIHERIVKVAQEKGVITGRRMRVDTTVVETNIHYPTDSTLLGDGVRVLTRTMKKITKIAGEVGTKLRDRSRSVKFRLLEIGRAARAKAATSRDKLKRSYGQLLDATSRVVGQAKRFSAEIVEGVKQATGVMKQMALEGLRQEIDEMVPLVKQVMKQTRARIFRGNTRSEGKLVSVFEPSTEIIRKGKASKPTEFGKMVKLQEAENQIITAYEVYAQRPSDSDLLIPAIDTHQALLGCVPRLVAADAAFYSARNEAAAKAKGVKRVCIPNRATKSLERKLEQKKRWFRNGQKWRTGCEGRVSVIKRRHGLSRCRYKGSDGMDRWVGLGVIADNLINIGRVMEQAAEP